MKSLRRVSKSKNVLCISKGSLGFTFDQNRSSNIRIQRVFQNPRSNIYAHLRNLENPGMESYLEISKSPLCFLFAYLLHS